LYHPPADVQSDTGWPTDNEWLALAVAIAGHIVALGGVPMSSGRCPDADTNHVWSQPLPDSTPTVTADGDGNASSYRQLGN
jgi:hypothetical protein